MYFQPTRMAARVKPRELCVLQDVKVVFSMFDLNDDGSINLREFEEITAALQSRLKRVSGTQRTGARLEQ